MSKLRAPSKEDLRIVWAIAAKDIGEALRNKNTISVLLSVLFIIVMYRALPALEQGNAPPNVLLYDAGESALVVALENSQAVELYTYNSAEDMKHYLANGQMPELGLVIPAGYDQALAAGDPVALQGYVLHWVDQGDILELERLVEGEATRLMGAPVSIQIAQERIYPWMDSGGVSVLTGLAIGFVALMTGMILPPHLMLEEKQAHTMDVLLVSPAGAAHVVIAKALTGLFYCFLALGVTFILNFSQIATWPLALLTAFVGSLFAVSLGLLLGTALENRQQLILWAWVLLIPMMMPMLLSLMDDLLPETWLRIFDWVPTVVMFRLFRASFSNRVDWIAELPQLAYVFVWALVVLLIVAWLVRRQDR
jgi:ABC-type transport system involved in multi-copper enzyme maturation permease subunit